MRVATGVVLFSLLYAWALVLRQLTQHQHSNATLPPVFARLLSTAIQMMTTLLTIPLVGSAVGTIACRQVCALYLPSN